MNTRNRRSGTYSSRVRPHIRRRNGVVEAPRYPTPTNPHAIAVVLGWRPMA